MVGVSVDQDVVALQTFAAQQHLSFPIGRDPDQSVANRYGTFQFPETYIIDQDGRVAEKLIGPVDWQDPRIITFVQELAARWEARVMSHLILYSSAGWRRRSLSSAAPARVDEPCD